MGRCAAACFRGPLVRTGNKQKEKKNTAKMQSSGKRGECRGGREEVGEKEEELGGAAKGIVPPPSFQGHPPINPLLQQAYTPGKHF